MKRLIKDSKGLTTTEIVLLVAVVIVLALIGWVWYEASQEDVSEGIVNSFEECAEAGYLVSESHPRVCRTPDGREFVEEVDEENEFNEYTSRRGEIVRIRQLESGDLVSSPLTINGQVRGSWSFEADFPIRLTDQDGNEITVAVATLQGDWMTQDYVDFEAVLEFSVPAGVEEGFLVLVKDNPSGEPEHDDEVEIPVRFN